MICILQNSRPNTKQVGFICSHIYNQCQSLPWTYVLLNIINLLVYSWTLTIKTAEIDDNFWKCHFRALVFKVNERLSSFDNIYSRINTVFTPHFIISWFVSILKNINCTGIVFFSKSFDLHKVIN